MKPRWKAPLAEAVPYTPNIVFLGNGVVTLPGGRDFPSGFICVDLR